MPATPPQAATRYRAASALLATQTAREAVRLRRGGIARVASLLRRRQMVTATLAEAATGIMLDAQPGVTPAAEVALIPMAFTTLETNLDAMAADLLDAEFERLVQSIMQDTARAAQQASVAARPHVSHVRHLTLPSCSRCAVLAGRVYRWSEGFLRHPNCFPAGTVVSGPGADRATRRWYEGELVVIRTAGGKELTATANHPVLTDQGWLPANLLAEGGYVLSRSSGDRSRALLVPNHDQVPARIEDVWSAGRMRSLGRVPVAAEDFHGDGLGSSEVDVVLTDGLVRDRQQVQFFEPLREQALTLGVELALAFEAAGSGLEFGERPLALAGRGLSLDGLLGASLGGHLAGAQKTGSTGTANLYASLVKASADHRTRNARAVRDRVLALASQVGGDEFGVTEGQATASRWDAPAVPFSHENRGAYASQGLDLRDRLSGDVERDRVIELRRVSFSGHVYNLTSAEGWYDANGIIVSNCDCTMIPVTVASPDFTYNPVQLAREGLVTGLSKADKQALDLGADFGQVVNVRSRKAGLTESGRVLARAGRPTPEALLRDAPDRDTALQLLTQFGYVR